MLLLIIQQLSNLTQYINKTYVTIYKIFRINDPTSDMDENQLRVEASGYKDSLVKLIRLSTNCNKKFPKKEKKEC